MHYLPFQHTAARRQLQQCQHRQIKRCCFNTQPHEGGCCNLARFFCVKIRFQHTATRRWLPLKSKVFSLDKTVSTHSHPKVAAIFTIAKIIIKSSFNTQPPEGGCLFLRNKDGVLVAFQHTATRRWLRAVIQRTERIHSVSTHSHPKVAASSSHICSPGSAGFNTQPPEGGCFKFLTYHKTKHPFQHTATRRWLPRISAEPVQSYKFQHTATRRWLLLLHLF